MSDILGIEKAMLIMGTNFIGPDELNSIVQLGFSIHSEIPRINYSEYELNGKKNDYYLMLGVSKLSDGKDVTIRNMLNIFGKDPEKQEPCFYNQDWYDHESFIDVPMNDNWFLVRKSIVDDSRAVQPAELQKKYSFPSAIQCTYAFFVSWLTRNEILWENDYLWCNDVDHNGDRIYVGRYRDNHGMNKNGFNIHRFLSIGANYGCIE